MFFVTGFLKLDNYVEQDNFSKYRTIDSFMVFMRTPKEIQRSKYKECRNDAFIERDRKQPGQYQ